VLLVWGTEDKVIPFETSRRVLAAMPQAELLAVERAAHTPNYERPELVNAAMVAWLGRLHAPR
jgi:pimeloyl-ACP methyl ester carboxylesterase